MFAAKKKLSKDQEVIRQLCQMGSPYTRDLAMLQQHQRILIFVFDDMMQGRRNFDLIAETSVTGIWPLAHCYTVEKFHLWKKELGDLSYPVALEKPVSRLTYEEKVPARIHGQVYAIRPIQFLKLDIERENGVQFTRRRVKVQCPYIYSNPSPEIREEFFYPMMYIGNHDYWDDQFSLNTSRPVEKTPDIRSYIGEHYRFK